MVSLYRYHVRGQKDPGQPPLAESFCVTAPRGIRGTRALNYFTTSNKARVLRCWPAWPTFTIETVG